jgi:periplasmic copper chaperone A
MRLTKSAIIAGAVIAVNAFAAPAFAHVTANPNTGPQEGRVTTFFRVGHGCEGDAPDTERVSIQIPEGVIGVGPEDEPGWSVETKIEQLDQPIETEEGDITEVVTEVIYTAEDRPLDTHQFREFGLSLNLAAPGEEVLWFPVVQKCGQGSLRWVNIPPSVEEWGATEDPAPYLTLAATEEEPAEEAGMTEDDVRTIAAAEAADVVPEDETDPMVWVALALGAIGFFLGVGAFVRSGKGS